MNKDFLLKSSAPFHIMFYEGGEEKLENAAL